MRPAASAFFCSSMLERLPPTKSAATPGIAPKMFQTALICPDMACCWPSVEVRPFCALATNRNATLTSTTSASRLP